MTPIVYFDHMMRSDTLTTKPGKEVCRSLSKFLPAPYSLLRCPPDADPARTVSSGTDGLDPVPLLSLALIRCPRGRLGRMAYVDRHANMSL
jgi:hypothetical protein